MSRRGRIVAAFVLALLGATGLARAQPPSGIVRPTQEPAAPSAQLGAQLYAGNCASCHGIDGSGIAAARPGAGGILGAGPSLRGVGAISPDFYLHTGYMPLNDARDQPMRERVLLSEKEIRSLVAYVASLGAGPGIPRPHPNPATGLAEGFALFTDHCAGCHQSVAEGGLVTGARVPPLHSATATEIAEAVRLGPYLMPSFSTRQISDRQLDSIVAYVLSTRHPDDRGGWGIGNIGPVSEGIITWAVAAVALVGVCMLLGARLRA
jgi:ubiquinol-cytochrome c reductase cytochrome c subunit